MGDVVDRKGPAFDRVIGAAGGATLGVLVTLALGPEAAGIFGNASGPLLEELSYAVRQLLARQVERVEAATDEAIAEGACDIEELLRRALADERRAAVMTTVLRGAAVALDDATVRALGRAYARGVLTSDDAKVDEQLRVASTLAAWEPVDIRVLHLMRNGEYWVKRPKADLDTPAIVEADPGVISVVDAVVARLATQGVITDEATSYGAIGKWQITEFGRLCLAALLEVGYGAVQND